MSHKQPYHDAGGECDSADVDDLARTAEQMHISHSSPRRVPRTLEAGSIDYDDADEETYEHHGYFESGDAEGSHTFEQPYQYGDPGEEYDEQYDDGEEYEQAGQDEATESGAVDPLEWNPMFHLDPAYQVYPDKDWFVGSIVMVYWAEPKGQSAPKGKKGGTSRYTLTEMVHTSFRRMVVVKCRNGSSFCCPISTYGGRGCRKTKCKPKNHGVIYDDTLAPQTFKDEKKLGVEPVGATMIGVHTLDPASRVNYGNGFWVQHNIPVMFIGYIPDDDLERVKIAYRRCITEGSDDETEHAASSSRSKSHKSKKEAMSGDWNETKKKKKDGKSSKRSKQRH